MTGLASTSFSGRRPLRQLEQAHVFLLAQQLERVGVEARSEQHLDELL